MLFFIGDISWPFLRHFAWVNETQIKKYRCFFMSNKPSWWWQMILGSISWLASFKMALEIFGLDVIGKMVMFCEENSISLISLIFKWPLSCTNKTLEFRKIYFIHRITVFNHITCRQFVIAFQWKVQMGESWEICLIILVKAGKKVFPGTPTRKYLETEKSWGRNPFLRFKLISKMPPFQEKKVDRNKLGETYLGGQKKTLEIYIYLFF